MHTDAKKKIEAHITIRKVSSEGALHKHYWDLTTQPNEPEKF